MLLSLQLSTIMKQALFTLGSPISEILTVGFSLTCVDSLKITNIISCRSSGKYLLKRKDLPLKTCGANLCIWLDPSWCRPQVWSCWWLRPGRDQRLTGWGWSRPPPTLTWALQYLVKWPHWPQFDPVFTLDKYGVQVCYLLWWLHDVYLLLDWNQTLTEIVINDKWIGNLDDSLVFLFPSLCFYLYSPVFSVRWVVLSFCLSSRFPPWDSWSPLWGSGSDSHHSPGVG